MSPWRNFVAATVNNPQRLVIIGAGGHGKVVAECAEAMGKYGSLLFLDSGFPERSQCLDWPVVGEPDSYQDWMDAHTEFFIAIGNNVVRGNIQSAMSAERARFATLIHPSACISSRAKVGSGTLIMPGVVVNADTRIGLGCIVNTSASLDHDCLVGDFVHVAPGVNCAGNVTLESGAFIGIGSAVIPGIRIGTNAIVGAGSAVIRNVAADSKVAGSPAKPLIQNT